MQYWLTQVESAKSAAKPEKPGCMTTPGIPFGMGLLLTKSNYLPYIADCMNYFLVKRFLFLFLQSEQSMAY